MDTIVNKVAESGIMTLDPADFIVAADQIASFDLKPFLFREMILREKDYREALKQQDWSIFEGKDVHIWCSADAIIPMWAYMLGASYLQPVARSVSYGTAEEAQLQLMLAKIRELPVNDYTDKRIVIKGCGDIALPAAAYVAITELLQPVVKSIMYGEPCSTVPVYKKKP